MQEVFEKIIEKLRINANNSERKEMETDYFEEEKEYKGQRIAFRDAIDIVNQEAEKFNNAIIDGKYCFQSCACTEKCDKCSRLCNGDIDWYENIDDWLYQPKGE